MPTAVLDASVLIAFRRGEQVFTDRRQDRRNTRP